MWTKHTFLHNENQKVWFISDSHFCHNKPFIYEKRGFKSVQEHDETLIERWNNSVSPNDIVIHAGDFLVGAGRDAEPAGRSIMSRLHGFKVILWGNHNSFVKNAYQAIIKENNWNVAGDFTEIYPLTTNKFGAPVMFVGHYLLCKIKTPKYSQFVFCSHYAHRLWIDSHKGEVWHISGHSHGSDPESQPEHKNCKRLDVGIENFGGPVSFDEVANIMRTKNTIKIDHHDKNTSPSFH